MCQNETAGLVRMKTGVSAKLLKAVGAGEGNRTLVFSLEVVELRRAPHSHSDLLQPCGELGPLHNFPFSEWRREPRERQSIRHPTFCFCRRAQPSASTIDLGLSS